MNGKAGALLTIAGYDPTSGAGVMLDTAVFRRFGFHGLGILTSVTVQNTVGVKAYACMRARSILAQYRALVKDVDIRGLKVGMLGCRENIAPVARILSEQRHVPRVVDPVLRSSSGRWLLPKDAVARLLSAFRGRISVLTPNMDEAGWLSGASSRNLESMKEAARIIAGAAGAPVVVKGGHLPGTVVNVLYDGAEFHLFEKPKLPRDVHGTGCFFSSTLLAFLASETLLVEAVRKATDITHEAVREAVRLGKGRLIISPVTLASAGRRRHRTGPAGPH